MGGAEPALEHLWQAGQLADAARAWEDAERSYQRALAVLELLPAVDASRRGELELAHGHALERSGRADAARAAFRLAAATGQANDEPRLLALAALGYGRAPSSTDVADPELLALLDSALRAIGPEEEALRSRLLGRQAVERSSEPDGAAAAGRLGRQAVELAERAGDDSVLAVALASLHWTLESPDTLQERCRVARASLQLAQGANDLERVLGARIWWIFDLLELGDIPEVLAQLDAYERLAESLRHPGDRAYARVIRASLALLGGDLGAASGLVAEAHEGLVAAQDPDADRVSALQRFVLHQQAGRYDEAERAALDYPCPDAPGPAPLIRDALLGVGARVGRAGRRATVRRAGRRRPQVARHRDGARACRRAAPGRRGGRAHLPRAGAVRGPPRLARGHRLPRPGRRAAGGARTDARARRRGPPAGGVRERATCGG